MSEFSRHAEIRMQQRAIPKLMVALIEEYGTAEESPGGTKSIQLRGKQKKRLRRDLKSVVDHFDSLQDVFIVKSNEDTLITTAHAYKKRKRA